MYTGCSLHSCRITTISILPLISKVHSMCSCHDPTTNGYIYFVENHSCKG